MPQFANSSCFGASCFEYGTWGSRGPVTFLVLCFQLDMVPSGVLRPVRPFGTKLVSQWRQRRLLPLGDWYPCISLWLKKTHFFFLYNKVLCKSSCSRCLGKGPAIETEVCIGVKASNYFMPAETLRCLIAWTRKLQVLRSSCFLAELDYLDQ